MNTIDTLAVFGVGILVGAVLFWSAMRYGVGLTTRLVYQLKEDMPPLGVSAPEGLEQEVAEMPVGEEETEP